MTSTEKLCVTWHTILAFELPCTNHRITLARGNRLRIPFVSLFLTFPSTLLDLQVYAQHHFTIALVISEVDRRALMLPGCAKLSTSKVDRHVAELYPEVA
jgi:hypothetical protein